MLLLQQLKRERYTAADPEVTVRRLRNGEPVTLDLYRSKKEKLELLSSALDSLDGNAINAVSFWIIFIGFVLRTVLTIECPLLPTVV